MEDLKVIRLLVVDAMLSIAKGNPTDALDCLEDADRQLLEAIEAQTQKEATPCA